MKKPDSRFDPTWRDDVFDLAVLDIPLIFPEETPPNGKIWIATKFQTRETVFRQEYCHEEPRKVTAILKRSDLVNHYQTTDEEGNVLPSDHPLYDVIFKPKAWMTDSMGERCVMFAAAKQAKGRVLVGGLGLAVYPQMVFYLQRPIESLTILESNPAVIALVQDAWLRGLNEEQRQKVKVIEGTIEGFLQETSESFETIYFDTWEDADPRFLPHINHLIELGLSKSTSTGQIQCWGYAMTVDVFIEHALMYAEKDFPLADFNLDPGLERYFQWLQAHQENKLDKEMIETVAREIALTTIKSQTEYDRHFCFTPFALSYGEAYQNMERARKRKAV